MDDKLSELIGQAKDRVKSAAEEKEKLDNRAREVARNATKDAFKDIVERKLGADVCAALDLVFDASYHASARRWYGIADFKYRGFHFRISQSVRSSDFEIERRDNPRFNGLIEQGAAPSYRDAFLVRLPAMTEA